MVLWRIIIEMRVKYREMGDIRGKMNKTERFVCVNAPFISPFTP